MWEVTDSIVRADPWQCGIASVVPAVATSGSGADDDMMRSSLADTVSGELSAVLSEQAGLHGVPGAAAGVLVGGEVATASVGVTNVEHPLPVTDTTLFQVGSITKTFVSTAILLLAEEGKLALDDPVGKHLTDAAGADRARHRCDHDRAPPQPPVRLRRRPSAPSVASPTASTQLADARRLFEPGTGVSYNNAAFSIAGEVIAAVSGTSFETFINERVLRPLDIKGWFTADEVITHRVAAPHFVIGDSVGVVRGTGWQPGWELGPIDRAAGGLITSVVGLLAWARFQLDGTVADGSTLLSLASRERAHTPVVHLDRWTGIGLDWFVITSEGGTTIDHGGLTLGYCSSLVLAPKADVAVVCLTHATNGARGEPGDPPLGARAVRRDRRARSRA